MNQRKNISQWIVAVTMAIFAWNGVSPADAEPPRVRQANVDYEASGFVVPAGGAPLGSPGSVDPAAFFGTAGGGCDSCSSGCDSCGPMQGGPVYGEPMYGPQMYGYGGSGCDSGYCGTGGCDEIYGDGRILTGGILGKICGNDCACGGCGASGCKLCGGLSNLRYMCMFCRGEGCSACQMFSPASLIAGLHALKPYTEAGRCALRWYDLSAEAVFLGHNGRTFGGGTGGALTSQGVAGPTVLSLTDSDAGANVEAGIRLSGAFIFGAGGNIEGTYLGGNQWDSSASVSDPNAELFSFISEFGTNPGGAPAGFDDPDRSLVQSVSGSSEFHSAEINYRRRTMGPYCRFQGSWLLGLRYVRFENGMLYSALGENDNTVNATLPRFFSSDDQLTNSLLGPQAGFDLWYNVTPGINLGIGMKGAWVQNTIKQGTTITANSIAPGATAGIFNFDDRERESSLMTEFETKLVYRLTHSWSFRSAYYLIAADDIAYSGIDGNSVRSIVERQNNPGIQIVEPEFQMGSLVVQGFSFGTEYIW